MKLVLEPDRGGVIGVRSGGGEAIECNVAEGCWGWSGRQLLRGLLAGLWGHH